MRTLSVPLALLTSVAGCISGGDDTVVEPESDVIASDLEKADGGFTLADEAAQFGDVRLFQDASLERTSAVTDSVASDPAVLEMQARPDVAVRSLVVMWGQLPRNPAVTEATTWSGRIVASRGAVVVAHKIGFEDRTDVVLPREQRDTVAFTSITFGYSDGLALRVVDPSPGSSEPLTLTYYRSTGEQHVLDLSSHSLVGSAARPSDPWKSPKEGNAGALDIAALAQGPIVIPVDDVGNKIVVAAIRRDDACDAGTMRGRWRKIAPNLGHFVGVVADKDGQEVGHVRGIFGERRNGESVVLGKFINRDGMFRGVLWGTYDLGGHFQARWLVRNGDDLTRDAGRLRGVYLHGTDGSPRGGVFLARWAETSCSDDT